MRRSHRRAGHKSTARRPRWVGSAIWSVGVITVNSGDIGTYWAKWPAQYPDTRFFNNPDEPVNETLVRSVLKLYFKIENFSTPGDTWFVNAGLIAWDTVNPSVFDAEIVDSSVAPDPFASDKDWILRQTYIVPSLGSGTFQYNFPTLDLEFASRAQRKLPDGTGVLFCVSFTDATDADGSADICFGGDARMLIKQP